jgi:transcriptional regulator
MIRVYLATELPMYMPDHFRVDDEAEIFDFLRANAFGQLISLVEGRLFSSHIPFLFADDRRTLFAHLAKANPQWRELEGQEVLITFQGAHDYVSPSWYQNPGVPTWNYQAVHIYARCHLIEQQQRLAEIIHSLTNVYESAFEKPWQPQYADAMLKAIVGLQLDISDIQCKYKLNQNRSPGDRINVAEQYRTMGDNKLYHAMLKTIPQETE